MDNKEAKETLKIFKETFRFLEKDFGFSQVSEAYPKEWDSVPVLIYKNKFIQLEIAGSIQHYVHAEIRKLHNGVPKPYTDKESNIGFEDLAILESNGNYADSEYYGYSAIAWKSALLNTTDLLKRHKEVFTTDKWVDNNKINQIKNDKFYKQYGVNINRNPSYFQLLKHQAIQLLTNRGYTIILDSEELAPYDHGHLFKQIIFTNGKTTIKLGQQDWRDSYNIYYIEIDSIRKFEIDLFKHTDTNEAVAYTIEHFLEYL